MEKKKTLKELEEAIIHKAELIRGLAKEQQLTEETFNQEAIDKLEAEYRALCDELEERFPHERVQF